MNPKISLGILTSALALWFSQIVKLATVLATELAGGQASEEVAVPKINKRNLGGTLVRNGSGIVVRR